MPLLDSSPRFLWTEARCEAVVYCLSFLGDSKQAMYANIAVFVLIRADHTTQSSRASSFQSLRRETAAHHSSFAVHAPIQHVVVVFVWNELRATTRKGILKRLIWACSRGKVYSRRTSLGTIRRTDDSLAQFKSIAFEIQCTPTSSASD